MRVDGITYCDKCESIINHDINEDRALDIRITGGYGMFIDTLSIDLLFCHSCSVELFRSIPSLSPDKINGMHSVSYKDKDYPLCCEYSWTIDSESEERDEYGNRPVILGTKEHFDKWRKS